MGVAHRVGPWPPPSTPFVCALLTCPRGVRFHSPPSATLTSTSLALCPQRQSLSRTFPDRPFAVRRNHAPTVPSLPLASDVAPPNTFFCKKAMPLCFFCFCFCYFPDRGPGSGNLAVSPMHILELGNRMCAYHSQFHLLSRKKVFIVIFPPKGSYFCESIQKKHGKNHTFATLAGYPWRFLRCFRPL